MEESTTLRFAPFKKYLVAQRWQILLLVPLLFTQIALQVFNPRILGWFIDSVRMGAGLNELIYFASLYIGVALLTYILIIATVYVAEEIGWAATNLLRTDLVDHTLRLDLDFHQSITPGELIEKIDGDVQVLAYLFSQLVLWIFGSLLLVAAVLVALFILDWRIGLAFVPFVTIALIMLFRMRKVGLVPWEKAREASGSLYGFIEERLTGSVDIQANGASSFVQQQLWQNLRSLYINEITAWRSTSVPRQSLGVLFAISNALILGLGAFLTYEGALSLGDIFQIYAYTVLLFAPLGRVSLELEYLQEASASVLRVSGLLGLQSSSRKAGVTLSPDPVALSFDNVSFDYNVGVSTLRNISFDLEQGKSLGLIGNTGSGKTTIARLLLRFYEPLHGTIKLGEVDLCHISMDSLRQRVGLVSQEVNIFTASVRDNLTLFDPAIGDERILAVINELRLDEWLEKQRFGLDSILSSASGTMSAGEAQLLAFARVFLVDPSIVILDEASSRLDPATERILQQAISRLIENRTSIIIAHRLATIRKVDEILILEAGQIIEQGSRSELERSSTSVFRRLLQTGMPGVAR